MTGDELQESTPPAPDETSSRRGMLRLALASLGATIVATNRALPADAATGGNVILGDTANNNYANRHTSIIHNTIGGNNNGPAVLAYRTSGNTLGVSVASNAAVYASTDYEGEDGVRGLGGGTTGVGVHGFGGFNGVGVQGTVFGAGYGGVFESGGANVRLVPAATLGPPIANAHQLGELYVDSAGTVFLCRTAGTPGTWSDISGPSLHLVTPTRVYDSREAQPQKGALSSGQNRTISVADGRAVSGGAVNKANLVPAGATGISYTITVVNTFAQGFLTVNPGGVTTVGSVAVNWFANGQITSCGSVVSINAARQITVIAGGGGTTDFVIDVVGYYL